MFNVFMRYRGRLISLVQRRLRTSDGHLNKQYVVSRNCSEYWARNECQASEAPKPAAGRSTDQQGGQQSGAGRAVELGREGSRTRHRRSQQTCGETRLRHEAAVRCLRTAVGVCQGEKDQNFRAGKKATITPDSVSSTNTRIISSHPKKTLLEKPFVTLADDHLHPITHLPLSRCGWKITPLAVGHSWMPPPASPFPRLMRGYQE